jgi:hypothetical protein
MNNKKVIAVCLLGEGSSNQETATRKQKLSKAL